MMGRRSITIFKGTTARADGRNGTVLGFEDFKASLRGGGLLKELLHYDEAKLVTYRVDTLTKPLATSALLWLLSRGPSLIEDQYGGRINVTRRELTRSVGRFALDWARRPRLLRTMEDQVRALAAEPPSVRQPLDLSAAPVYLRTDLWFGVESGGSIGHIAGVLNHLSDFAGAPVLLTTDRIPTVLDGIETHLVLPEPGFWDFAELPSLAFNETFDRRATEILNDRRVGFFYQRYSPHTFAGVKLARRRRVPLVLEYNGSEVWASRHWARPFRYERLAERIELLNLRAADVLTVVSSPIRDELLNRGIDDQRILVNPNGVDPVRYSPAIDGSAVRARLGLEGKTVIGFIGTFGPWHGAEVLAEAFARVVSRDPRYPESLRLLMIGDGVRLLPTRQVLRDAGVLDLCVFTGRVPQEAGAEHLAACDLVVSSHVPNPDGSPFFGSPTKLFEYMAMGKGIVASSLEQIAEVLEHDRTGWLVPPGNAEALADGLRVLIDDSARRGRLGCAARDAAVARYTWREHTRRILDKLQERCG